MWFQGPGIRGGVGVFGFLVQGSGSGGEGFRGGVALGGDKQRRLLQGRGFRSSGFGVPVPGFGFRVPDFGFRVSGLGCRV